LISTSRRGTTAADLDAIQAGRESLLMNVLRGTFPLTIAVFAVVYIITRSTILAAGFATPLLLASLFSNVRFRRKVRERAVSSDPGAVEVLEVAASHVLDLEPVGDNGPAYCFFGADETALLLVGQWLLDYPDFPALSFRLHRWANSGDPIRIEVTGASVEPVPSNVVLHPEYRVREIELFPARPDTLAQDLARAFAARV
jgi:hypothetical protein